MHFDQRFPPKIMAISKSVPSIFILGNAPTKQNNDQSCPKLCTCIIIYACNWRSDLLVIPYFSLVLWPAEPFSTLRIGREAFLPSTYYHSLEKPQENVKIGDKLEYPTKIIQKTSFHPRREMKGETCERFLAPVWSLSQLRDRMSKRKQNTWLAWSI